MMCRVLLAMVGLFTVAFARADDPKPVKLLFVGSSSTYWNDLPREVARLVDGKLSHKPKVNVLPEIVGRSGSDIRVYSEPGFNKYEYGVKKGQTFLDKIRVEKPDFVVLQVVCSFAMSDDPKPAGAAHLEAVTHYCEAIRKAGGEPIFYEMGWGKGERETNGRERLFELAVRNKIRIFVPCSTAWARVYKEKPDLALQHPMDGSHPGDAGHFLNLACFYAALTGESPVGQLPRQYPVWPHALGKRMLTDEQKMTEDELVAKYLPDAYQKMMPKWMRKNMAMGGKATIDDATAKYLETVAWEEYQRIGKKLATRIEKH